MSVRTARSNFASVLQVVPTMDAGGVEQTTLDIAEAVIAAGGRAVVATKGGRLEKRLAAAGAHIVNLPMHSKNPFVQWGNYFALKKVIAKYRVDIVHARSRAPAMAAFAAAKAMKVKSLATYHGIYNARLRLKKWYNSQMIRGDITIANSDYTRQHILSTYDIDPAKVITVPRGVDMVRFDPATVTHERLSNLAERWGLREGDSRPLFVLAGRLTRWKGHTLILEALNELRLKGTTGFRVIFAGDPQGRTDYVRELKDLIETYRLTNNVHIVGHCSDMPAAFQLCDFALAPSLDPEAFGRTAVEPQAMHRPVLAADHGATAETVIHGVTGWLIKARDSSAWATAIETALSTPREKRQEMGKAGYAHVARNFTLKTMCETTLGLYRNLLKAYGTVETSETVPISEPSPPQGSDPAKDTAA